MNTSALPSSRRPAATPLSSRAKRWLYLIHRWAGIVLCLFFAMWFISGMVMMYVGYPKLTPQERLAHLPPLDAAAIAVTP
ncbi:PepSY domain-containing protein, partial [Achromobacter anxifer]|nr:PepSY domain-containing protein [Achromobacter anxifer]